MRWSREIKMKLTAVSEIVHAGVHEMVTTAGTIELTGSRYS